ncbi:hypothetical protein AAZX31_10G117200 [Glycine max]
MGSVFLEGYIFARQCWICDLWCTSPYREAAPSRCYPSLCPELFFTIKYQLGMHIIKMKIDTFSNKLQWVLTLLEYTVASKCLIVE